MEQEAIESLESRVGREFTEEDVRVNKTQQNGKTFLEAELTGSGQEQVEFEQFQREFQAERDPVDGVRSPTPDDVAPDTSGGQTSTASDAVSAVEEAKANTGSSGGSDAVADIESSGETGQTATKETAETSTPDTGGSNEIFGGRGDFENRLRAGAGTFRREFVAPVADTADDVATAGGSVFAMGSPVTADDPARAAESDTKGEGVGDVTRGAVQGAGEIANLPQYGVTAIEAGEVGRAFVESSPAVEGGRDGLDEFGEDAVLAGERTAGNVAEQATENPAEFGGELLGGAIVGSGAATAARRALGSSSGAGTSVDVGDAGSNLGSRGTGSLLDADALDDAQGVTGPSATSRARGRFERSDTFQSVRDSFRQFRADESAQLRGRQRPRDSGSSERVDDRTRGFESEVRRAALEQREFTDFQDLDRGGINDRASRGARTRPEAEASSRLVEPQRRRSRQAQQSEVLDGPAELSAGGGLLGGLLPDGASSAVTQGAQSRLEQAQQVTVTPFQSPGVRSGPGLDVGLGPEQAAGADGEVGLGVNQDFGTRDGFTDFFDGGSTPSSDQITEPVPDETNLPPRLPGIGLTPPDSEPRPRVPDDGGTSSGQLGGGLLFGGGSQSDTEGGAGTDFVAETLTGFGEGGLNVEAAQAADSGESGFLSTAAQADNSDGFTAAQELFGVGGEP